MLNIYPSDSALCLGNFEYVFGNPPWLPVLSMKTTRFRFHMTTYFIYSLFHEPLHTHRFKSTTSPVLQHDPFKLEENFVLYSIAAGLKHDLHYLIVVRFFIFILDGN